MRIQITLRWSLQRRQITLLFSQCSAKTAAMLLPSCTLTATFFQLLHDHLLKRRLWGSRQYHHGHQRGFGCGCHIAGSGGREWSWKSSVTERGKKNKKTTGSSRRRFRKRNDCAVMKRTKRPRDETVLALTPLTMRDATVRWVAQLLRNIHFPKGRRMLQKNKIRYPHIAWLIFPSSCPVKDLMV